MHVNIVFVKLMSLLQVSYIVKLSVMFQHTAPHATVEECASVQLVSVSDVARGGAGNADRTG